MRILFYYPSLDAAGGAQRVIITLANNMVKYGHIVQIQTIRDFRPFYDVDGRVTIKGSRIKRSKNRIIRYLQTPFATIDAVNEFAKDVNEFNADVVISFFVPTNDIAILSRKHIRAPIVVSERNDPIVAGKAVYRIINSVLYTKADVVICQGERAADYYRSRSCNCLILPNPLNSSAVGEFKPEKNKRIVAVGRLTAQKNHMLLIDSFAKVQGRYKDYTLDIIGEGPLKESLEKHIHALKLQDKVKIHSTMKNVMTKVNDAACFVLPSNYEGMPNVLIEAMASGMPVVSTDFGTGIARELITDGVNGFVVPVGDVDKMAEAIEKVISSKELQNRMGMENLKVRKEFEEEIICSKWEKALIGIVNEYK